MSDEQSVDRWVDDGTMAPHARDANATNEQDSPADQEVESEEGIPEETGYGYGV